LLRQKDSKSPSQPKSRVQRLQSVNLSYVESAGRRVVVQASPGKKQETLSEKNNRAVDMAQGIESFSGNHKA
jgi:hypothetical protein